jgi:hypothetical protein
MLARIIDMREKIDSFEEKTLIDLKYAYKDATDSLMKKLESIKNKQSWTNDRLVAMLDEVTIAQQAISDKLVGRASDYIAETGAYSYSKMNDIVGWDGKAPGWNTVSMSQAQLKQLVTDQPLAGKPLSEWIGSALAPDVFTIKKNILSGSIAGYGYDKVVADLAKQLSLEKGSKEARDLETVVKTYNQSMAVKAQKDVYNANKSIVQRVEWSAILEGGNTSTGRGTCPRCISLDGSIWGIDEEHPNCPLHARCRCLLLPVTKTWKEMGFDIPEMEKQYSPWFIKDDKGNKIEKGRTDQTYHEWFMSRDKTFQNNAIGPIRAGLVRDGKLKLTELVDQQGMLIPIKDLGKVKPIVIPPFKPPVIPPATIIKSKVKKAKIPKVKEVAVPEVKEIKPITLGKTLFDNRLNPNVKIEAYEEVLNKLPDDQKRLINKFPKPKQITVPNDNRAVYFGKERNLVAGASNDAGRDLIHEYGHHIDSVLRPGPDGAFKSANHTPFKNAFSQDAERLGLNEANSAKEEAARGKRLFAIKMDLIRTRENLKRFGSYSDIIDAMSTGDFFDKNKMQGHGRKYYSRGEGYRYVETFANLFTARADPLVWDKIKTDMPNLVATFEKMIEEAIK